MCCLEHDLQIFSNGADTEIGERGINASGGQKARISLARAVYADADIYLLDDPLSAVDPDVAGKLYQKCIEGHLKDKCVVLVTHQVQHLKNVQDIIVLDDGKIKIRGDYQHLKSNGMDIEAILKQYQNDDGKKDEIIIEDDSSDDEEEDDNAHQSSSSHSNSDANETHLPAINDARRSKSDETEINEIPIKKVRHFISSVSKRVIHQILQIFPNTPKFSLTCFF